MTSLIAALRSSIAGFRETRRIVKRMKRKEGVSERKNGRIAM